MNALFTWIEDTSVATSIASSVALTASLSAVHLIGFTLVTGGALLGGLRSLGLLLRQWPAVDIVEPGNRAIQLGLAISLVTGALLFAARATAVSANGTFRLKMLLLVAAAVFHFTVQRRAKKNENVTGAIGLALWFALAVTACAFILLE